MSFSRLLLGPICFILLSAAPLYGEDWPTLGRDRSRNPVSNEKNPPVWWQEPIARPGQAKPARNIKWSAWPGSHSKGDPVVANGLVWVGTNNGRPRDPSRKTSTPVLMCFRESDGKFLWQHVTRPLEGDLQDVNYAGHSSAPLVEGERVYFTTARSEVVCLDTAPLRLRGDAPKQVWTLDMARDLGVRPGMSAMGWGRDSSVASLGDRLFVLTGNGCDFEGHVRAPAAPGLVCIDKHSGKLLWQDNSPGKDLLEDRWGSPLVVEIDGQAQVIAGLGDGWLRAFDAQSGKQLWRCNTNPPHTNREKRSNVLATPVFHGNRVYITSGRNPDHYRGAGLGCVLCLNPTKRGDISLELAEGQGSKPNPNTGVLWRFGGQLDGKHKFTGTLASPVIADGLVIVAETGGWVHCLDARTGQRHWTHHTEATIAGSPLVIDGKIFIAAEDDMHILGLSADPNKALRRDKGKTQPLWRVEFESMTHCSPVFANGVLYVATGDRLLAIAGKDTPALPDKKTQGHWPQWRGPDRNNIAREQGLLTRWPEDGPPLAWKADGLGNGVQALAVAGGRIFTLGYLDGKECVLALDERDGKVLWKTPIAEAIKEFAGMRWLCQRMPTVDGDKLYAVSARGDLACLDVSAGKIAWRKNYAADFQGKPSPWGFCDFPLIDGDKLICTPAGPEATIVALDKRTGEVLWKCAIPRNGGGTNGAIVAAELGGVRQYGHQIQSGAVGISAADGKLLWSYPKVAGSSGNSHTALVHGEQIFCANGWGQSCGLIKIVRAKNELLVEERYSQRHNLDQWLASSVIVDGRVYSANGWCVDLETGKAIARFDKSAPRMTMTCFGKHLIYRFPDNRLVLVEATANGFETRGEFKAPRFSREITWTFPVIAGGKLYLRDQDVLLSYDLTGKAPKPREPDAIFVPTPEDVVDKMLELAQVKKDDVLYDLGCGDGRIVRKAAQKLGCKTLGCDLDSECVRMARELVKQHKLEGLVTIQHKDLFTMDLSSATVVTLYLGPKLNAKLIPQLNLMKPGSRIVSHNFDMPGIRPDRQVRVVSQEDGVEHVLYLWTVPLRKE